MGSRKPSKKNKETVVKRNVYTDGGTKEQTAANRNVRSSSDNARWIVGVLILLAGVFALLATVAYPFCCEHDYIAIHAPETDNPRFDASVSNPCGKVGAQLAEYFVCRSFGLFGLLVPVIFIMLGIRIIVKKPRLLNHGILAILLIIILGSLTLGLMFGDRWGMFNSGWGGAFGIAVSQILYGYIGAAGAWIAVILGWILTGVFINSNFINTVNRAGKAVVEQGGVLVDNVVDKAGTLLHRQNAESEESETEYAAAEQPEPDAEPVAEPTAEPAVEPQTEEPAAEMPFDTDEPAPAEKPVEEIQHDEPAAGEMAETEESDDADDRDIIEVEEHSDAVVSEREMKHRPFNPDKTVGYKYPPVDFLIDYVSDSNVSDDEIIFNKRQIEETLGNFGVPIREMKATIGPTVTLYEIVQEAGVKIARIQGLENDIAQSLKALGIRIIAPIPGRGTIGIEVPNRHKEIVSMRSAVQSERFHKFGGELPVVIGRTIQNENFVFDLAKMPHLLVAGATGQGKSVGLNAIITSLLYRKDPSQLKLVLIDPKMVEFSLYAKLEKHFLAKMASEDDAIVTDPKKAVYTLNSLCMEMDVRLDKCRKVGARNIAEYNEKVRKRDVDDDNIMPYIVVIIDEFADLIMTAKEVEAPVMRLAQKARAIGIHLIVATQRPDVKVITGGIKANFPARIAFRVMQMIDSRTIIDQPGANQLIGRGDMLLSKDGELTRIQCALVETKEVEDIVNYISRQPSPTGRAYDLPDFVEAGGDSSAAGAMMGSEGSGAPTKYDSLFAEIARDAVSSGQISTSYIQRNYEVGFNRAGRIMTQLERAGIVGPQVGAKQREIKFYDMPSLEAKLQELGLS